ncbi:hypothetical protein AB3S75_039517 [Citrus x aurantiifolia]
MINIISMSKDLKFQQINLPKLKPSSKIQTEEEAGEEIQAASEDYTNEDCKTPTSSDHKIPKIQSCPTTPRKKVQVSFHKRKMHEFLFFEATGREEVESFFRSNSELFRVDSHAVKKRCSSKDAKHTGIFTSLTFTTRCHSILEEIIFWTHVLHVSLSGSIYTL